MDPASVRALTFLLHPMCACRAAQRQSRQRCAASKHRAAELEAPAQCLSGRPGRLLALFPSTLLSELNLALLAIAVGSMRKRTRLVASISRRIHGGEGEGEGGLKWHLETEVVTRADERTYNELDNPAFDARSWQADAYHAPLDSATLAKTTRNGIQRPKPWMDGPNARSG